jgi:hypothetical protein
MAYNTSRWTLVALISQILLSLQQLLILCSTSIKMQRNAICTLQMYQRLAMMQMFKQTRAHRKRIFEIVNGLLEAKRFKNLLL